MTTANHSAAFRRHAEGEGHASGSGATRIGSWTFTPGSSGLGLGPVAHATLQHDGRKIELSYSSTIFEDFLHAMSAIHSEFNRRSTPPTASGTRTDERAGAACRV
ncbi:hypothetical protein ACFV7Q_11715 [Streptomyces sp. NPDC059851]|uniref:hypothetical protein n=1 Tax=Streptomyces sp. NPDC059851 TaxID=3346971 RepID=UPI003648430E